jgi:hypothetical protein
MSVASPKLTRLVRDLGKTVFARYDGKWESSLYVADLIHELAQYDLNDPQFRNDIAKNFVRADIARRANVDPFDVDDDGRIQLPLLSRARFRRGVIRIGNGLVVKMNEATSQEWIVRQFHQQEAAAAAHLHAMRTTQFLQTPPGRELMENPRLKTEEAFFQLGLWTIGTDGEEDDDDDVTAGAQL